MTSSRSTALASAAGPGSRPCTKPAWHGADLEVVDELLRRGAWWSPRTASGRAAQQIAAERGHERLAAAVAGPEIVTRVLDLETYLAAPITVRALPLEKPHRMPQLGPLVEQPHGSVWCAIPGMYGGFHYRWLDREVQDALLVESWSPVVGPSGQRQRGSCESRPRLRRPHRAPTHEELAGFDETNVT